MLFVCSTYCTVLPVHNTFYHDLIRVRPPAALLIRKRNMSAHVRMLSCRGLGTRQVACRTQGLLKVALADWECGIGRTSSI